MGKIYLIAAVGKNNELGKDNELIWYIKEDLQFFKNTTMNKTIVMGYNTFKSLKRVLPNRKHVVLTSHNDLPDEVACFNNIDDVLNYIKDIDEVYIIGGASIYKLFINLCDGMYLTEIDKEYDADVYFPEFDENDYNVKVLTKIKNDDLNYTRKLYERK